MARRHCSGVRSIIAIVAGGLITNLAVAWGLSIASPWETRGLADGRAWHNGSGFVKVFWFTRAGAEDVLVVQQEVWPEVDLLESISAPPQWFAIEPVMAQTIELDVEVHRVSLIARARGWPLLALRDQGSLASEDAAPVFATLFPLQPIWRGCAVNTVFYGGFFAILFICGRVVRRALLKRGLATSAPCQTATGAGMCGCGA